MSAGLEVIAPVIRMVPRSCPVCSGTGESPCFPCGGSGRTPAHRPKTMVDELEAFIDRIRDVLTEDPDAVPFVLDEIQTLRSEPF